MREKAMGRRLFQTLGFMLLTATFAAPEVAQAAGVEARERAAKIACTMGDYGNGVAILAEMFVSTGNPIHIFNQGRCFEQNGKYEEAIARFREFQGKHAEKELPGVAVEKHIAECETLLGRQRTEIRPGSPSKSKQLVEPVSAQAVAPIAQASVTPPVSVAQPATSASPRVVQPEAKPASIEPQPDVVASPKPAEPASGGLGLRVAGVVTAAVGLGGIATGAILNVKANNLVKDLAAAKDSTTTLYSRDKDSTRSRYQTWGWIAYGAGAACLAGGAVMYYLGYREAQVAFVPTVANGQVGASLQGAF